MKDKDSESYLPTARYVGPQDEIRTGAPAYQGGRIYPVDPEAAAKLRAFWEQENKKRPKARARRPANNVVVNLARTLHERRKTRGKGGSPELLKLKLEPQQEAWIEMLLRAGNSDEELRRYRRAEGIHHKTLLGAVNRIRARIEKEALPDEKA